MTDNRNWLDRLTLSLDEHKGGLQYGSYSLAILGLAFALRSVRPFQRFVSPNQIPASFLQKHLKLRGKVLKVNPSLDNIPTTLSVDHFPVISLGRPSSHGLPVEIASIDLTPNGISWLNHVVVGKEVQFTLLKTKPHSVSCIVNFEKRNLGLDLVSLGFGTVSVIEFDLQKDTLYLPYYKLLLQAENKAERMREGIWFTSANKIPIQEKVWALALNSFKAAYSFGKIKLLENYRRARVH